MKKPYRRREKPLISGPVISRPAGALGGEVVTRHRCEAAHRALETVPVPGVHMQQQQPAQLVDSRKKTAGGWLLLLSVGMAVVPACSHLSLKLEISHEVVAWAVHSAGSHHAVLQQGAFEFWSDLDMQHVVVGGFLLAPRL